MPAVIVIFLLFLAKAVVIGELDLRITKNKDGLELPVGSFLKLKSGANFLLNCQVFDTESEQPIAEEVLWIKKQGKLKKIYFSNKNLWKNRAANDANLNFTSINLSDQGKYLCMNLKHRLFKAVHITVVLPEFLSIRSQDKTQNLNYQLPRRKLPYKNETNTIQKRDLWNDSEMDDLLADIHEINRRREAQEDEKRREEARRLNEILNKPSHLHHPVEIFFGVVAVLVLIAISIWFCFTYKNIHSYPERTLPEDEVIHDSRQLRERIRRICEAEDERQDRISYNATASNRANGENLIGNDREGLVVRVPLRSYSSSNVNDDNSGSARNISQDRPPSYVEAVSNAMPSAPPPDDPAPNTPLKPKATN